MPREPAPARMLRVDTIAGIREALAARRGPGRVGLVPTMGALHAGHASLIARARRDCATVVVSIFVNPLQFDRQDDLAAYPRALDSDLDACRELGVDLVFAPAPLEMYPQPPECVVEVGRLADHLCGRHRPGHFRGVATVVLKLLQIAQPDAAFFGEKDAQQLAVIRRMVRDLNVPVEVVGLPTVREDDGLALSSRNRHLDPGERRLAPALYRALVDVERLVGQGVTETAAVVKRAAEGLPRDERLRLEYLELVDPDDLQPVGRVTAPVLAAGALWVGATRLIDNVRCEPQEQV
jgi:pantoate--beta-alanine ligase